MIIIILISRMFVNVISIPSKQSVVLIHVSSSDSKYIVSERTNPVISGITKSALHPNRKSTPGHKPTDVLFRIRDRLSPPKLVVSLHFQPVACNLKLWPIPTYYI